MKMQLVGIALALSIGTSAFAQTSPPFGTLADTAYAAEIWAYLPMIWRGPIGSRRPLMKAPTRTG